MPDNKKDEDSHNSSELKRQQIADAIEKAFKDMNKNMTRGKPTHFFNKKTGQWEEV